ncbi:MAG: acyl carrier protein [Anaerolineae bacterium]|nr:acyl carrier protein [Anaerolineae bacterium]
MTIETQIKQYVAENFLFSDNGYSLPDDASFLEEGVIDSTGVLELILFVEETFGLTVANEDVLPENFDSVTQLAAYIRRKL